MLVCIEDYKGDIDEKTKALVMRKNDLGAGHRRSEGHLVMLVVLARNHGHSF